MAVVAESPIELVSSEPTEGMEMILDSESISMSSSEVSNSETDPNLQTSDMDVSPTKEETDESMSSISDELSRSKNLSPSEKPSNSPAPEDPTPALVTDAVLDICDTPIEACDITVETCAISPESSPSEGLSKDSAEGTVQVSPDPSVDPADLRSAPETPTEEEDEIKVIDASSPIDPKKEEQEEEEEEEEEDPKVKEPIPRDVITSTEAKVKSPSVTLKFESSKLEVVENNINKVIHKARSSALTPSDVKTELGEQIRALKKSDLETLITDKIIEAIAIHSNVGALSQKLIQSNTQRDRLFHKISNLQRQVTELSKAVRSVSENVGRNQKAVNKANQPIRFYRSVGVQVVLEGTVVNPPRKSTPVQGEIAKSILKSGNNNAQQTPPNVVGATRPLKPLINTLTPVPVGVQVGNVNPNLKRPLKPTITVAEVTKLADLQSQAQSKIRKVSTSPVGSVGASGGFLNGGATKITVTSAPARQPPALHQIRNPAAAAANKALTALGTKTVDLSVVDLTDDEMPAGRTALVPASSSNLVLNGSPSNVVLAQNGLQQYRLISPGQQFQFIQAGKSYQLVTSGAQTRPVFVSPASIQQPRMGQIRPATASTSPLVLRGMTSMIPTGQTTTTPISINGSQLLMRPVTSRPPTNTVSPMVAKQSFNIVTTRPGITVTTANPGNNKVTFSNGIGTSRITSQHFRPVAPQVNRVVTRPVEAVAKKFILPPLPPPAITGNPRRCSKDIPPRPELTLVEQNEGIVLSWTLKLGPNHAEIQTYQIYACQEPLFNSQKSAAWKRVGDVKALPLPMACTLSQFTDENRYHFIVRGVDVYNRTGPFCEASAIKLMKKS
ncbi:unnamed protein product [Allacma fusca]|uniref:Activating transcription factor 7-interacting protein Fn3 domain-containing protein n=1 Tax=Allacma fusca TaxID=39272 RepID=A0A8J2JA80_9HEXA|nr:unnamed protein product [Allacma fusca]